MCSTPDGRRKKCAPPVSTREWLDEHRNDPDVVAGCARLGRILGAKDADLP